MYVIIKFRIDFCYIILFLYKFIFILVFLNIIVISVNMIVYVLEVLELKEKELVEKSYIGIVGLGSLGW